MTPINTLLPIARRRVEDKKLKELLGVTIHNVNYMKNLVIKTLQLAHLNSPNTQLEFDNLNLLQELNYTISFIKHNFKKRKLKIENNVERKIFIKADKLRFGELIDNLISNAINYSLDNCKISIKSEIKKDFVIISIKDNGIGLTKNEISHIFDEFYKVDKSRHKLQSSGLGLPICKRIVERHGGKIWAESQGRGKGSTFCFTIPLGS